MAKLKDAIKNLGNAVNNKEPEGYYVTDMLKSFGTDLTGTQIEGKGITDVLNDIADNYTGGGGSATLIEKSITENGTYAATSDNADGYSQVVVNVESQQPTLVSKTITENGTYNALDDSADGYSEVEVNIQPISTGASLESYITAREMGATGLFAGNEYDPDLGTDPVGFNNLTNVELDELLDGIDTSSWIGWSRAFTNTALTLVPDYDTSSAHNMSYMFENCFSLTNANIANHENFTTENVDDFTYMFHDCRSLTILSMFDMSHAHWADGMCMGCSDLVEVTFQNWAVNSATPDDPDDNPDGICTVDSMFGSCTSLERVNGIDWSKVANTNWVFGDCPALEYIGDSLTGLRNDLDISASTEFTAQYLTQLINSLDDISASGDSYTFTIGQDNLNKLDQTTIDDASAKGWTLA